MRNRIWVWGMMFGALVGTVIMIGSGCSTDKNMNRAKMSGAKYWTDKAYPGKAFDVQVTEATKVEGGKYRVKAMVDGTERVGLYDPEHETFDEGYYTLSHERGKKLAEMDEEVRYMKDRIEKLEKENYQLKLRLKYVHAGRGDPNTTVDPNTDGNDDDDVKPVKKAKAAGKDAAPAKDPKDEATQ